MVLLRHRPRRHSSLSVDPCVLQSVDRRNTFPGIAVKHRPDQIRRFLRNVLPIRLGKPYLAGFFTKCGRESAKKHVKRCTERENIRSGCVATCEAVFVFVFVLLLLVITAASTSSATNTASSRRSKVTQLRFDIVDRRRQPCIVFVFFVTTAAQQKYVFGLYVSMDDPTRMEFRQRHENL